MNVQIDRSSSIQLRTNTGRTDGTSQTTETTTGSGVNGTTDGTTPDVANNSSLTMQLSAALRQFAPQSSKDFEVILASVSNKMKDVSQDSHTLKQSYSRKRLIFVIVQSLIAC